MKQLQAKGYETLALDYLERLEQRQLASPEFQQRINYHQGAALIQAALRQRSSAEKQTLLDRAQTKFDQFIQQHSDDVLAVAAKAKLADILLERARLMLFDASQDGVSASQRNEHREQARKLFDEAAGRYRQNIADLRQRLEKLPKSISPDKDAELFAERNQLRADYVQANFVTAMILYEQAQSYDDNSKPRRELLEKANNAFASVAQKYRDRVAGVSANLFQGRCQQQLGEPRKALAIYEDLLSRIESEALLRTVAIQTLRGAMECSMDEEINQWEAARQRAEGWLSQQRPTEAAEDDWLAVKYLLAVTYDHLAGLDDYARERSDLLLEARKLSIEVAKYRSEWQKPAQQLLAQLGTGKALADAPTTVASLADAIAAIREQLSQRQLVAQTIATLSAGGNDGSATDGTPERIAAAKTQLAAIDGNLHSLIQQANDLVDEETTVELKNQLRYYDCTTRYYQADYFASAVLAEFLSSRYPSTEEGRRATAVLLASLVQIYGNGQSPHAKELRRRMADSAERIALQWKGQSEADDALATLVSLAVADGAADAAISYLERMSEASEKRAAAELAAGQALWNAANAEYASEQSADSQGK
ncbi:MAG: hypothetical protein KDB23_23700, partial [Planctomycetales bacterium]|nr:hypothetical protein [Planctomycetales bacterium]